MRAPPDYLIRKALVRAGRLRPNRHARLPRDRRFLVARRSQAIDEASEIHWLQEQLGRPVDSDAWWMRNARGRLPAGQQQCWHRIRVLFEMIGIPHRVVYLETKLQPKQGLTKTGLVITCHRYELEELVPWKQQVVGLNGVRWVSGRATI